MLLRSLLLCAIEAWDLPDLVKKALPVIYLTGNAFFVYLSMKSDRISGFYAELFSFLEH